MADIHLRKILDECQTKSLGDLFEKIPLLHEALRGSFCGYEHEKIRFLLGEDPSGFDEETAGLRRRQFVISHPVWSLDGNMVLKLTNRVDGGYPSVPDIAKYYNTKEVIVKLFSSGEFKVSPEELFNFLCERFTLPLLEGMDPSWLKHLKDFTKADFMFLNKLNDILENCNVRFNYGISGKDYHLKSDQDHFYQFVKMVGSTLKPINGSYHYFAEGEVLLRHLQDMSMNMADELMLPAQKRLLDRKQTNYEYFMQICLLSMGIPKLLKSLKIHLDGNVHNARLGLPTQDKTDWPLLAQDTEMDTGDVLRFLRSQEELDKEGKKMHHCVGSYGRECRRGSSHIMSIGKWKNQDWIPSSTVEIRLNHHEYEPLCQVVQHYGYGNGYPEKKDVKLLRKWLKMAHCEEIPLNSLAMKEKQDRRDDKLVQLFGEAWRTPEAHNHRWDRWRRILDTRQPTSSDWFISLPEVIQKSQRGAMIAIELAMDMDEEMKIQKEIDIEELSSLNVLQLPDIVEEDDWNPPKI